jgi:hypothetical protein
MVSLGVSVSSSMPEATKVNNADRTNETELSYYWFTSFSCLEVLRSGRADV